ncbi:hypothetical protein GE09DRAFT_1069772, partial [Coniochaeta sp. 2T2.1]
MVVSAALASAALPSAAEHPLAAVVAARTAAEVPTRRGHSASGTRRPKLMGPGRLQGWLVPTDAVCLDRQAIDAVL